MESSALQVGQQGAEQVVLGDKAIPQPLLQKSSGISDSTATPAPVHITYYTDPLCSWSWGFEPQWRRLRYEFGDQLHWSYRMGGMIANWQQYGDPLNDVSRPVQMGPQWFQVRTLSGMPIEERIWFEDPPGSSYPACIAVKAAERQGQNLGEVYLRRVREAVMVEQRNVARREVLTAVAQEIANAEQEFNLRQFQLDLEDQVSVEAFRADLQDARYREIGRFPALVITTPSGQGILMIGYRPYVALRTALAHVAPKLEPVRQHTRVVDYVAFWGRVTVREVAEALELEVGDATQILETEVAQGELSRTGVFYDVTGNRTERDV